MFQNMPPIVKNLLLVNILFFVATFLAEMNDVDLTRILGMYNPSSPDFQPFQMVTHMFMHGGFFHILFNMYALVIFGSQLERVWGPKRFFLYYVICGIGAALIHSLVGYFEIQELRAALSDPFAWDLLNNGVFEGYNAAKQPVLSLGPDMYALTEQAEVSIFYAYKTPMVGASGAVFGLLLGFGMFFPNLELYLMFIPIPIKAKYFVMLYGAIELYQGFSNNPGDNVAHFAHLGGLVVGFIVIQIWRFQSKR